MTPVEPSLRSTGAAIWVPLVALWLVWGSTYLGIAVTGRNMPPFISSGGRFVIAAAILAAVIAATRGPRALAITWAQARATAIMGVMLLGVGIGTLSIAERYVPSGLAALIVGLMPMWVVVFRVRSGDRPTRATFLGVAIGIVGLAVMLLPGGTTPASGSDTDVTIGSVAIVCSSFIWALFSWRARKYDVPANSLVTAIWEMAFAATFLLLLGLATGERVDIGSYASEAWAGWIWLIIASIIGYSAYSYLLVSAPMQLTATYAFVNPVVAVALGLLILGEPVTRDIAIGLAVVVGGVSLIVLGERRKR